MDCLEVQPHLPVLSDGELTPDLQEPVDAHLSGCAKCRATVERWAALRAAASRASSSFSVPSGLDQQISLVLAAERGATLRQRRWTGGRLISAAAVLLVAVSVWKFGLIPSPQVNPVDAASLIVSPAQFVKFYGACASEYHCDTFNIRQEPVSVVRASIADQVKFSVAVPDLGDRGYQVDGGCTCMKLKELRDRTIHVYYRRNADDPNPVSIFSIPGQVRFPGPPESVTRDGKRVYQEAVSHDVVVLMWSGKDGCYAVCAKLPKDELYELVDSLDFAAVIGRPPPSTLRP